MNDIAGKVIGVILVFLMLGVTPLYFTSIIESARDQELIMNATQQLIDGVVDTGQLTQETLDSYYTTLATANGYYNATILHKIKMINPDPSNPGSTYTSYVAVDDIYSYERGDEIIVKVDTLGESYYQKITRSLLGLSVLKEGFSLAGRVR